MKIELNDNAGFTACLSVVVLSVSAIILTVVIGDWSCWHSNPEAPQFYKNEKIEKEAIKESLEEGLIELRPVKESQ